MNTTEFCERRVLPLVMAFACGVLAMKFSVEHREHRADALAAGAMDLADRAVDVVHIYREACGEVWEAGRPLIATLNEERER
ncbi:hypothetical protein [Pseudazoarcus pumilus]|uniref:Uncharacterized protein n=1 Tax=Pseudazoarcus pumilus TaxID=2067960 RepID=A0A2I6S9G0_9RHOO|nr:hypothetical protein [Pseudazoarcus pumilus]AUN95900.1 hypothetical protein C0099_13740 [Pseudazoarcus pumilus]